MSRYICLFLCSFLLPFGSVDADSSENRHYYPNAGDTIEYLTFTAPANKNGAFEVAADGDVPTGWSVVGSAGFSWKPSPDRFRTGANSMKVALDSTGHNGHKTELLSKPFAVQPGDALKFNAWFFADGQANTIPQVRVEVRDAEAGWSTLNPIPHRNVVPSNEWFPLGKTVVTPPNASAARLVISIRNTEQTDLAWYVDDAYCEIISFRDYVAGTRNARRLNDVLLLGTDTLRQSPLGCYGAQNSHTPNMDLLTQEGVLYRHVLATSMWTRPSFASIFTSLYPSQHTAEQHHSILPETVITVAELLQRKGYFTVGFAKTRFDGFVGPGAGFAKGFDAFFHVDDVDKVTELTDAFLDANHDALAAIEGGGIFIFRHIFDPHAPYRNHFPNLIVNEGLLEPYNGFNIREEMHGIVLWGKVYPQEPGVANEKDIDYARRVYYSEAWYTDKLIGQLFTRLRYLGLYENMNIILCSDHGESFNETDGVWNHGNPYNTCAEVPLIVRAPGLISPGTRNEDMLVTNLDIMPTILTIADVSIPPVLEGHCLITVSPEERNKWGIAEDRKCGSLIVRDKRYKLIAIPAALPVGDTMQARYDLWRSIQPGTIEAAVTELDLEAMRDWVFDSPDSPTRFELYDLKADPFENNDIAKENPEKKRKMLLVLLAHGLRTGMTTMPALEQAEQLNLTSTELEILALTETEGSDGHVPAFLDLDQDTIEALRAQGYL